MLDTLRVKEDICVHCGRQPRISHPTTLLTPQSPTVDSNKQQTFPLEVGIH